MSNVKDILWIEKYRPKDINDMILNDSLKARMLDVITNPSRMPHFIFIGQPGSGKTTLSKILISSIIKDDSDVLMLNGSDKRGIEAFRVMIPEFLSIPPLASPIKIVFIDEGDNMTHDAKYAFKSMLEKYQEYGRFIITANEDTFISAIKSRFEIITFSKLNKSYIFNFCKNILDKEKIEYNDSDIHKIIDLFYPDVRKIVGIMQQNSLNNKLSTDMISGSNEDIIVGMLLDMVMKIVSNNDQESNMILMHISKYITNNYVDFIEVYKSFFNKLSYKCVPLKVIISRYLNLTTTSISPGMVFYEFIYDVKATSSKLKSILTKNDIIDVE